MKVRHFERWMLREREWFQFDSTVINFFRTMSFCRFFLSKLGFLIGIFLSISVLCFAGCTPRVQQFGSRATTPSISSHMVVVSDGTQLPLRTWKSTNTETHVIVALHGFNDYSNTYAYDQRGFGNASDPGIWPGIRILVQDLYDVIEAVRVRHNDVPIILAGSSMGGAVVLAAYGSPTFSKVWNSVPSSGVVAGATPSVQGAILAAPAVWGRTTMNPIFRVVLWLMAHVAPAAHISGRKLNITPSDNLEMLRALSQDPLVIKTTRTDSVYGLVNLMDVALDSARGLLVPTLVLYGGKDEIIPRGATRLMVERLGLSQRFVLYPEGYHMLFRDLQAETVWRDALTWVRDQNAELPSGLSRNAREMLEKN